MMAQLAARWRKFLWALAWQAVGRRVRLSRRLVAWLYLRGEGIEIGALHDPLPVPPGARVRYLDRHSTADLRRHYPTLRSFRLVAVDIVDDGETLGAVADDSQDFIIANHFLEHCEDPLHALGNMLRVAKPGGVLYVALPDKRWTFDRKRAVTPLEHLVRDFAEGPAGSRREAYEDYLRHVEGLADPAARARRLAECEATGYSIHVHVWTEAEILELAAFLRLGLEWPVRTELLCRHHKEVILVLAKTAPLRLDEAASRAMARAWLGAPDRTHPAVASGAPAGAARDVQRELTQLREALDICRAEQSEKNALIARMDAALRQRAEADRPAESG